MARILIVEDEGILALNTEMQLTSMGHTVVGVADNAAEAIDLASQHRPEIILMDIVLKGRMDGIKATEVICGKYPGKIIYMTANNDLGTLEKARAVGYSGFLLKPFEKFQLQEVIQQALS